ncbi:hypothetical protein ACFWPV_28120, partial [Streptomyces uncialis]|uniref:hypothetical protein n=1 Tax=Streptomyces uncialis TaxID=1048205 RepID=UPI00365859EE
TVSVSDFLGAFRENRFRAFPFRRFRLYQILSGLIPGQRGLSFRLLGRSDVPDSSGFVRGLIIESLPGFPLLAVPILFFEIEFGHAEINPVEGAWLESLLPQ